MLSPIQKFVEDYKELSNFLTSQAKISESIEVNNHYRKILLLSCASFYENQITSIIQEFVKKHSTDDRVFDFMNNKAIQRQYHTFFNWNEKNINSFLGLFGADFKQKIANEIKSNEELQSQVKAFLEIGNERNKMVHGNFLEYKLEKTIDEIFSLHIEASKLIEYIRSVL
ncbi:MAG: hypothetical protein E7498_07720 [Ruminococcus sp.]|nr:hypothetical protein [Ruminococcus sp.]